MKEPKYKTLYKSLFASLISEVAKLTPETHSAKPKNKDSRRVKELKINLTSYHGHYTALKLSNLKNHEILLIEKNKI